MKYFKLLSIAIVLSGFSMFSYAQTLQEAAEARNKGAELMSNGDIDGAITELEKCVDISTKVGPEADEHKIVAEGALPGLYLQRADKILKSKDYSAALKAFEETVAVAEKYNNSDVKEKAESPIPMVYYAMGVTDYQANKLDDAIKNLDKATQLDSDLATAYFTKGVAYQKQQNDNKMVENYKLAIEKGQSSNDNETVKKATTALRTYYFNEGIQAMKVKNTDNAITAFTACIETDDTYADAYYRLASCYNTKKQWDNALTNAEKALEYKGGDDKAKAGIYYELGNAYAGKKDNGNACASYKKALFEPYTKAAQYQIDVALKCK